MQLHSKVAKVEGSPSFGPKVLTLGEGAVHFALQQYGADDASDL